MKPIIILAQPYWKASHRYRNKPIGWGFSAVWSISQLRDPGFAPPP